MAFRKDLSAPGSPATYDAAGHARSAPAALKPAASETPAPAARSEPATGTTAPLQKKSRKRLVLSTVGLAVLGVAGYEGYGYWTDGRFMVSTDDAYIQADITILAAKASGYVAAVEVENNQRVEAGQVIARVDDVDYRLAVQAASDKLATQQSTIQRIGRQVEAANAAVGQIQPQIDAARAEAERSAADFERQTRLSQSDYASRSRLEQAKADRDKAVANVAAANAARVSALVNVDVLKAQQSEAEKMLGELRTALAKAERDLSFTVIRAPVAGVLGNRAIEVGGYVQPGTRLGALVPLSSVHIDANFKETQIGSLRPGQKVAIEVDAVKDRTIPGTVESLAPASGAMFSLLPPENATGNFTKIVQRLPVRIHIDPKVVEEQLLRPGMSVVVRIDSRDRPVERTASTAGAR
jgi:membrane fusion protein (multidrug efflux system)